MSTQTSNSVASNTTTKTNTNKTHLSVLNKDSTLVNVILFVCSKNTNKNRELCEKEVLQLCNKYKIVNTKAKTKVTEKNVHTLLAAMCRDMNNNRRGWWSNYKVTEDNDVFKFVFKSST